MDLTAIKPNVVSKSVASYTNLIYGVPKIGKTTLASKIYNERTIIGATEKGYKLLEGAMIQDITTWRDWLTFIGQLSKPEVKEMFDVVLVDTVDLLWDLAEKYVLSMNKVKKLNEVPYGALYQELDKTFADSLNTIERLGYTLAFISHSKEESKERPNLDENGMQKVEDDGTLSVIEYKRMVPSLNKRGLGIVSKKVDNILFCNMVLGRDGKEHRAILTRDTLEYQAGTRFKTLPAVLPLDATKLKEAIEKDLSGFKEHVTDEVISNSIPETQYDFKALSKKASEIMKEISATCKENPEHKEKVTKSMKEITARFYGESGKVSQATEEQVEQLDGAVEAMQNLLDEIK